jgi:hypothetical protein
MRSIEAYPRAAMERVMKVQDVMLQAMAKKISWWQAAEILGISDRHMRRIWERYAEDGYNGLPDRRRDKPSRRRVPIATVEKVFALYREKYFDLNVQRLVEDGIDPWLDEKKLLPGQEWEPEIRKAVRTSDVVLVCLSSSSITKSGFVQKEIRFALVATKKNVLEDHRVGSFSCKGSVLPGDEPKGCHKQLRWRSLVFVVHDPSVFCYRGGERHDCPNLR